MRVSSSVTYCMHSHNPGKMTRYRPSIPSNVPINQVSHVDVNNLGFVLTLRTTVGADSRKQSSLARETENIPAESVHVKKHGPLRDCLNDICLGRSQNIILEEDVVRASPYSVIGLSEIYRLCRVTTRSTISKIL